MEHSTQIVFILSLASVALANGHLLSLGLEPPHHGPGHPGPPDIFDPFHLLPPPGMFDPLGPFHHRHQDFDNPGMHGPSNPPNEEISLEKGDNIKVTTESSPLKVMLLPKADDRNNTVQKKDVSETEKKEKEIPEESNNTFLPQILNIDEPILRTNENKTMASKPVSKESLISNSTIKIPEKLKTENNIQAGDSIVFPDNIDHVKPAHKDMSESLNETVNINDNNKLNYTKNSDNIVFPGHNVQVPTQTLILQSANPVQNTNGNLISGSGNPSGISPQNIVYQALPVTNDIFPNRPAVYTTSNTGQTPLYTNVINTFPQNGQPFNSVLNSNNNNNYQNPSTALPPNTWNGNNLNQNVGIVNNIPPSNIGNLVNLGTEQKPLNNLVVPTILVNPNAIGNNQQYYNGQQQILQPANNVQSNNLAQQGQTITSGVMPYTYNPGNVLTQGNYPAQNNNNNIGQQFVLQNVGQTYVPNNIQPNVNGQQLYVLSNGNQLNNNVNNGQPIILNPQGNMVTSNTNNILTDNTQKYMLVNVNPQTIPQNGQANTISLQNGQLVALVPYQGTNDNNGINGQILNGNTVQPIQNAANPISTSSYTNQPTILMNNNNAVNPNSIGQNSLVNIGQTLYKLVPVNGNVGNSDQIPSSSINLISMKDKEDRLNATARSNG